MHRFTKSINQVDHLWIQDDKFCASMIDQFVWMLLLHLAPIYIFTPRKRDSSLAPMREIHNLMFEPPSGLSIAKKNVKSFISNVSNFDKFYSRDVKSCPVIYLVCFHSTMISAFQFSRKRFILIEEKFSYYNSEIFECSEKKVQTFYKSLHIVQQKRTILIQKFCHTLWISCPQGPFTDILPLNLSFRCSI